MMKFAAFLWILCLVSCTLDQSSRVDKFDAIADKIDPADREFPGGRGTDQLVIYTPAFGSKTGTNQYGIEAVVVNGVIQSIGGNNSQIPHNGFVLSGHGKMSAWMSQNLFPGISVTRNNRQLQFLIDGKAKISFADYLIEQAKETRAAFAGSEPSVREEKLSILEKQSRDFAQKSKKMEKTGEKLFLANRALETAYDLYFQSFPSRIKELRAAWYRLREKSAAELEKTIRTMIEIGFNAICPETIYGGTAIYPNAHPDLPQNPDFDGWDPLKELERLCKKYDMKLIPWVWVYFVGRENSPLVQNKSDWLGLSRKGENFSQLEKGYHFFCPSRKSVSTFLLEVYQNLLENYQIDGLQLDYIRYPVSLPWELGYCYCDSCRTEFLQIAGVDPMKISPDKNPTEWQRWNQFRIEQITSFVKQVAGLVKKIKPQVALSADVFPLFEESVNYKFQDWGDWLQKSYLDEIFTMSYTPDAEQVAYESQLLVRQLPAGLKGYVGLGPYQGIRPEILVKEIFFAQQAGANGVCLFSYGSLKPEQIEALRKGPFRNPADWH